MEISGIITVKKYTQIKNKQMKTCYKIKASRGVSGDCVSDFILEQNI